MGKTEKSIPRKARGRNVGRPMGGITKHVHPVILQMPATEYPCVEVT